MPFRRHLIFLLCALLVFAPTGAALHALSHMDPVQAAAHATEQVPDQSPPQIPSDRADSCGLCLAFSVFSAGAAAGALPAFERSGAVAIDRRDAPSPSKTHWAARLPRGPPALNLA